MCTNAELEKASLKQVSTMCTITTILFPTLETRPASQLARFLCGTEAMVHMAKILATVSQMISVLA